MYLVSAKINTRLSSRTRIKSRGSVIGCVHPVVIHTWMLNIFLSGRCVIEWTTRNLNGIVYMNEKVSDAATDNISCCKFSSLNCTVQWFGKCDFVWVIYHTIIGYMYISNFCFMWIGRNLLQNCKNTEHKKTAPHSKIFVQFLCTLLLWNARWVK